MLHTWSALVAHICDTEARAIVYLNELIEIFEYLANNGLRFYITSRQSRLIHVMRNRGKKNVTMFFLQSLFDFRRFLFRTSIQLIRFSQIKRVVFFGFKSGQHNHGSFLFHFE